MQHGKHSGKPDPDEHSCADRAVGRGPEFWSNGDDYTCEGEGADHAPVDGREVGVGKEAIVDGRDEGAGYEEDNADVVGFVAVACEGVRVVGYGVVCGGGEEAGYEAS